MGKAGNIKLRSTLFSAAHQSRGFSLLEVMVSVAILGVAIVAVFQLFSATLRSTKKTGDYTKALFYARSMLEEAYSVAEPAEGPQTLKFEGHFEGTTVVNLKSSSEDGSVKLYEIIVSVTWPPSGSLSMKGLRTIYEPE